MAGQNTLMIDDGNFDSEVIQANVPVLVDFWAQWCGPCQMMGPIIDEIADEYAGKAKVAKVDVDQARDLAGRYGIQSIPTVIVFHNGEAVEKVVGARTKADYQKMIDARLGGEQ